MHKMYRIYPNNFSSVSSGIKFGLGQQMQ